MNEIWNAIAHHLREIHPYLFINAKTYHNNHYIMIQKTNCKLLFADTNGLWFPRCIRHRIDLNDPDLFDKIHKAIQATP